MILLGGGGDSGLAWDSTTQGVSREGLETILGTIKGKFDEASNFLDGTPGEGGVSNETLETTIRAGWKGTDCDQWLTNLDSLRTEVKTNLTSYYTLIETEFNSIFTAWEDFQSTNVTSGQ